MRRPPPKHGEKRMWRAGCLCPACRAAATEDQAPGGRAALEPISAARGGDDKFPL